MTAKLTGCEIREITAPHGTTYSVAPVFSGVTRPSAQGISVRDMATAERVKAAFLSGRAITSITVLTDSKGGTWADFTSPIEGGRGINAQLRRLGF
jgi:hypothetical protein